MEKLTGLEQEVKTLTDLFLTERPAESTPPKRPARRRFVPEDDNLIIEGVKKFGRQWGYIADSNTEKKLWSRPCSGEQLRWRYNIIAAKNDDIEEEEEDSDHYKAEAKPKKKRKLLPDDTEVRCFLCGAFFKHLSGVKRHQVERCPFLDKAKKMGRPRGSLNKTKKGSLHKTKKAKLKPKTIASTVRTFEIEAIVGKKLVRRKTWYLVEWKGEWPKEEKTSWIKATSLCRTAKCAIQQFDSLIEKDGSPPLRT
jgi:hypothetical protein